MENSEPDVILSEWACGPKTLRLVQKNWREQRVLDLRLWYFHERDGDWRPTKSGIQLTEDNWRNVIESLHASCSE